MKKILFLILILLSCAALFSCDKETVTVKFICSESAGSIEGETVQEISLGESTKTVKACPALGYKFVCWSNGETSAELAFEPTENMTVSAIFEVDALSLPVVSIRTEQGAPIATKKDYVGCTVSVANTDAEYTLVSESGKIKLRGNSTASFPKKPYKLKFDEKVDLFGNGKAKTWTIIANYLDLSLARNYIAYSLGAAFDELEFVTTMQFADVYVNGQYDGVYIICEQVEVGKNRVDIDEDYTTPETGYLIEMDERASQEGVENHDWFMAGAGDDAFEYAIKSPDPEEENFTDAHVFYIKEYFDRCLAALNGDDFEAVRALLDVESFVDGYILDELMHCVDVGFSSFYMYKDKDGKLTRGPLWDYDLSLGNCSYHENAVKIEHLWAKSENIWYNKLLAFDEFFAMVTDRLAALEDTILEVVASCEDYLDLHKEALERNFERWEILGVKSSDYTPADIYEIETLDGQLKYIFDWLSLSLENLKVCYPST